MQNKNGIQEQNIMWIIIWTFRFGQKEREERKKGRERESEKQRWIEPNRTETGEEMS